MSLRSFPSDCLPAFHRLLDVRLAGKVLSGCHVLLQNVQAPSSQYFGKNMQATEEHFDELVDLHSKVLPDGDFGSEFQVWRTLPRLQRNTTNFH